MSKIRFIFAIILSLSFLGHGLLAEEVHSAESVSSTLIQKKRYTEDMNLRQLFEDPQHYTRFINQLRERFTN